ncbi:MAG: hypothetical protein LBS31_09365 [Candidatus Adiutrix sp.]|jgi:hypothetical protein|nr:hypothetical protein [Candidatus Adiutrix sp.]
MENINVRLEPDSDEVSGLSKHILYVEGDSQKSFDPSVLDVLFEDQPTPITIKWLGPSFHIKSAAQALAASHPHYYFLIDRDHHQDSIIDDCWNCFPDPAKYNLLIWRKREIENYFLDPDYLSQSTHLKVTFEELKQKILQTAQARLYLDVANQVIVSIREECKETWIEKFSNLNDFKSPDDALAKLLNASNFSDHSKQTATLCGHEEIKQRFNQSLNCLTGGKAKLEYGSGRWLDLIQGKPVLSQVINTCFKVCDAEGKQIAGSAKMTYVARSLLRQAPNNQPRDFRNLKQLICQCMARG